VDDISGRRIEEVGIGDGTAGRAEVRRADEEPRTDRGERGAELAAVFRDREAADRPVERGREGRRVGAGRGYRERDAKRQRRKRGARGAETPARAASRERRRDPQCFSFATASFISGTALKRSATRP
jgi:hypothetical protein